MTNFRHFQKGDKVRRMLVGVIPRDLIITEVTDDLIICDWWQFDRDSGIEVDDDISCPVSHLVVIN